MAIPIILVYFVFKRRRDLPFSWVFLMFGAFIIGCGFTHLMEVITFYDPMYRFSGVVKAMTAIVSIATAIALVPLVPKVLALRSPEELERVNQKLEEEVEERSRSERERAMAEARIRQLVESAPDATIVVNADGEIVLVNTQTEQLFGYGREELLGQPVELLIPERFRQNHPTHRKEYLKNPKARPMGALQELSGRRKDGTEFVVEISLSPIDSDQGVLIFSSVRDASDRQKAQRELRVAKETAEAASKAKGQFLATMSHEIRTPMNGIIGMTDLALDTVLLPEQREYLQMVRSSADSLLSVINEVLDFSKIEAGRLELDETGFSLSDFLGDTLQPLALRAHNKGLELIWRLGSDVPDLLIGDPIRLRQIIVNIVGNAVKFTDTGEIQISIDKITHNEHTAELLFRVSDTGMGIPTERQAGIFDPFVQADGTSTRKYGGTGLGLSIASRLVALMGGEISVQSHVGSGSVFEFSARFRLQDKNHEAIVTRRRPRLSNHYALIVDDNPHNLEILQEMLVGWELKSDTADSGSRAVEKIRAARTTGCPFSLALIDTKMPGMNGFELCKELQQDPENDRMGIVFLTSGESGEAMRCRELGVENAIMKPVRPGQLLYAIHDALNLSILKTPPPPDAGETHPCRPLQVLLAEDNIVNQTLVVNLLKKKKHTVHAVENGKLALEAWQKGPFDVILMDVEMPELDGLQAAKEIRRQEQGSASHQPIVALTAYAMKGDRERCLDAGMDAYLTKPIRAKDLYATLADIASATELNGELDHRPDAESPDTLPINLDEALDRLGCELDFYVELLDLFESEWNEGARVLRAAVNSRDTERIASITHKLRGCIGNIGANHACDLAERIAQAAKSEEWQGVDEALAGFLVEMKRVEVQIEQIAKSNPFASTTRA